MKNTQNGVKTVAVERQTRDLITRLASFTETTDVEEGEVKTLLQTVAPALISWIEQHRDAIRARVPLLEEIQKPGGRTHAMKQFIKDGNMLVRMWSAVVQTMQEVRADEAVQSSGKAVEALLLKHVPVASFSEADQRVLRELAENVQGVDGRTELALVQQAIQNETLSKPVRAAMAEYLQEFHVGEPTLRVKWSWGACAFCGALAYPAFGAAGAMVACIACGIFAQP